MDPIVTDLRRELAKAREALTAAHKHLTAHAEMNAALHCATAVMYSPLHAKVVSAIAGIDHALQRTESATRGTRSPSASSASTGETRPGTPSQRTSPPRDRNPPDPTPACDDQHAERRRTMNDDQPWTLEHRPRITNQTEARPGPLQPDGHRWIECRPTGLGVASCSCGYTTGLIPREQLLDTRQLAREHPPFGRADPFTTEGGAS